MRKFFSMLLAAMATAGIYTSCTPEVDDVFDKSSAERISEALAADKQILVSAPNGWRMEIYGNTDFGGYNLFLKFANDNTVEVASEKTYNPETGEGADVRVTSHYKLEQSAGAVLSFDEYNELIHFFSDPDNPDGLGTKGKGFGADLEYRILSASADSVVMTGKKHNNKIVLLPLANGDVTQTIKEIANVKSEMESGNYTVTIGSKVYPAMLSYRNLTIVTTNDNGERLDVRVPFVITTEGYKFYEPVTIDGHTLTGFQYVPNSLEYIDFKDSSVKLTAIVPPINQQFVNTIWFPTFSGLGHFGQLYWGYMEENVLPIINGAGYPGTLDYFYFGFEEDMFGAFYKIIGYWGVNCFDYQLIGEDEITLTYNKVDAYNGATFISSGFLNVAAYLVAPFGCEADGTPKARTFKITTDNIKNPSWVLLTDVDKPDNTIMMYAAEIYRPYNY
ncbi:MAG: DUF4302 domain-containing protein [Prevotella sp.]|nr:DUF4302 domain-containing protein [Prevotella sp.]